MRVEDTHDLHYISESYRDAVLEKMTTYLSEIYKSDPTSDSATHTRKTWIENVTTQNVVTTIAPAYTYDPDDYIIAITIECWISEGLLSESDETHTSRFSAACQVMRERFNDLIQKFGSDSLAAEIHPEIRRRGVVLSPKVQFVAPPGHEMQWMGTAYTGKGYFQAFSDTEDDTWRKLNAAFLTG